MRTINAHTSNKISAETKEGIISFLIDFVCGFLSVTAIFYGVTLLIKWGLGQLAVFLLLLLASLPLSNALSRKIHAMRK